MQPAINTNQKERNSWHDEEVHPPSPSSQVTQRQFLFSTVHVCSPPTILRFAVSSRLYCPVRACFLLGAPTHHPHKEDYGNGRNDGQPCAR